MARTLDFSNVSTREPLEEGIYEMVIEKVEEKVSTTGKDMLLVTFKEPESEKLVWENYLFQENCLWKLKELLDAVGLDTSGPIDFEPEDLVGQVVNCTVIQEEYNGSMKNRIRKVEAC